MQLVSDAVLPGDRIRLVSMTDDPDPIPVGTLGTVFSVVPFGPGEIHISVNWDNGRALSLICPPDKFARLG